MTIESIVLMILFFVCGIIFEQDRSGKLLEGGDNENTSAK